MMRELAKRDHPWVMFERALQSAHRNPRGQSGVVLFIALIVLVAMSLAGVALVRSVDTNLLIAGNLAFKQGATLASGKSIEAARAWVVANATGASLYQDIVSSGYSATWQDGFDPRTFSWDAAQVVTLATDAAGYTSSYVVHRMCATAGDPGSKACVKSGSSGTATSSFGSVSYSSYALSLSGTSPVYRITTRVRGPKNTTSYIQVVITV